MTNKLSNETSPYLLQHAENPVDWHPWGDEALALAKSLNKPILLSIGYSACHWCHVMAHESFEDDDTAKIMNELFVNVKLDREERPDLDKIYQTAHQLLIQRPGGWPLTMFLTPDDHTPFFGGTYFPKTPQHGLPAFVELLTRVSEYYHSHGDEIAEQKQSIKKVFDTLNPPAVASDLTMDDKPLEQARGELESQFDEKFGGFGGAPKFPHPTNIERLLRHWRRTVHSDEPDLRALFMATYTLKRMALGGVYDQVGGGFFRYSVDQYWMIPHFEKMLYDNGPLLALCSQTWQATGDELFRRIANETADWVIREMQSPSGGYYSTLDADSEGVEGKFYVWTEDQITKNLDASDFALFATHFGIDKDPNFEGHYHLHVYKETPELAQDFEIPLPTVESKINRCRGILQAVREPRVRPGRDDKILASWNGLMIRGMCIAARTLNRDDLSESATRAVDFIHQTLWQDNRLYAVHKDGRTRFPAYLDDYVFLLDGLLELLQVKWSNTHLDWAIQLADVVLEDFQDSADGGFFFTAKDSEQLLYRPKTYADEALPAGNGIAAKCLSRLGYLLGDTRYIDAAQSTLRSAWTAIQKYPHAHGALLDALEETLDGVETVIIRAKGDELIHWQQSAGLLYQPHRMVFAIPSDLNNLHPGIADKKATPEPVAYVCHGSTCSAPINALETLIKSGK